MEHGRRYTVKRLRLLQHLVENGFTEYTVVPDPTSNKGYNWFIFQNSEELEQVVTEYFNQYKKSSNNKFPNIFRFFK